MPALLHLLAALRLTHLAAEVSSENWNSLLQSRFRIQRSSQSCDAPLVVPELRAPRGHHPRTASVCRDRAAFIHRSTPEVDDGARVSLDRVAWVMITGAVENDGSNFRKRVVASAETWLRDAVDVYAAFADTEEARGVLSEAGCVQEAAAAGFVEFGCATRGAKVSAVLVPCANDAGHDGCYASGPCCKYDAVLRHLQPRLLRKDWIYVADDDLYVRTTPVLQLLSRFDPAQLLLLNADGLPGGDIKLRAWNGILNSCNDLVPQGFFYTVMSRGLLSSILSASPQSRLPTLCNSTDAAYDTTVGLWAWHHGASFIPTQLLTQQCVGTGTTCTSQEIAGGRLFNHGVRSPEDFAAWDAAWKGKAQQHEPFDGLLPQRAGRDFEGSQDACAPLFSESASATLAPHCSRAS